MQSTSFPDSNGLLRNPWIWLVLISGVFALGYLTLTFTWSVFDEGFVAKGGVVVLHGKLLIRDFLTLYGPAQFYLLAAMYWAFGVQLLVVRLWSALVLGFFGLAIYFASARLSGNSRACAVTALAGSFLLLLYAIPPPGYPMVPTVALLIAAAMPLHRFATTGQPGALGLASALIGCAALFRWDQGVFGLAALAGALVFWLTRAQTRLSRPPVFTTFAWAMLPGLGIIALVYVPLILSAGVDTFVQDVLVHSLRDFEAYRGGSAPCSSTWS